MSGRTRARGNPSEGSSSATTWPATSFLFVVNELPINDDTGQGGTIPRYDEHGRWLPPIYRAGFLPQVPGYIFRWRDGLITWAEGYQYYNGYGWGPRNVQLTPYRTTSMFWCNNHTQFLTADGDVSTRDIATSDWPLNRWYPLTFDHIGTLSRVGHAFEHSDLAGTGANWIGPLGLASHNPRRGPQATGLAGNLSTVLGLIAFSCQANDLYDVLVNDRAWRHNGEWRGHNRGDGREEGRGIVVHTYYDPANEEGGSTSGTLYPLEWNRGPFLR